MHGTLTSTTNSSRLGSNNNEGVLLISKRSRTGASPSDAVLRDNQDISYIKPIDGTLTGAASSSGLKSNGNEEVFHSKVGASISDIL